MNTLEALKSARAKIAAGYVRGTRQSWHFGQVVYCALGALDAAINQGYGSDDTLVGKTAVHRLSAAIPEDFIFTYPVETAVHRESCRVAQYNNETDQARTVALFDKAIAQLEAEEFLQRLKDGLTEPVAEPV